jgi:6-phosphogluconolactonase
MHKWNVYKDKDQASKAAAGFLIEKAHSVLEDKSRCNIALPGGGTPAQCLKLVAESDLPWNKIHWYLGDERCYPVAHEDRNDTMIQKNIWSLISSPEENNHPIPAELGPEDAAKIYSDEIEKSAGLDIILLGMGEDGHTASLFPNNKALENNQNAIAVYNSPKAPDERVSLSLNTLKASPCKMVLALGEGKRGAIKKIKNGEELPINRIGSLNWFVDEEAVS